ncbi:MAG: ABC transporter ATP-binding protein, partial [Acidimicrobiales bacterium]
DRKLREDMQIELRQLHSTLGTTFIYVTHDQEEALTMSDRLAVMSGGRIAQLGTPRTVYEEPADAYVADFLGISNLMDAEVVGGGTRECCRVRVGEFELEAASGDVSCSGRVKLAIRPERVALHPFEATGHNRVPAMLERTVFLGPATQIVVRLAAGVTLQALAHNDSGAGAGGLEPGTPVQVFLPPDALRVLPVGEASIAEIKEVTLGDAPLSHERAIS